MSLEKMKRLYQALGHRVKPEEDNVRLYWITPDSLSKALTIGSALPSEPPDYYIV